MIPSEPSAEFTPSGFDDEFASPADYARLYRLRGIQVVPAHMPGEHKSWKRPLLEAWKDFQEALVDDAVFASWYGPDGKYIARPNMGVITGRASNNLFVIDLDHHKHAQAATWWNNLMLIHNNSMDLETVEQVTGGGGSQKLYRAPPGWTAPTNKTPIGVDIRGQGGFAMLAPSLHESGRHYEWCDGKSPDDIPVTMAPDWLLEAVEALVAEHGGGVSAPRKTNGQGPVETYDGFGSQVDGREEYMRDLIWGAVVDWRRECPIKPGASESLAKAVEKYNVYERHVSPQQDHPLGMDKTDQLNAEGRGVRLFHVKWAAAMRHWDDRVAVEARIKLEPKPGQPEVILPKPAGQIMEYLDVRQIKAQPDPVWAIEDLVNERALGFIFGPPSSLKTFIALDIALSTTAKLASWWGHKINTHGAVIYLCREGVASLKFRIMAWEKHRKTIADDAPFYLIRKNLNFMKPEDIGVLLATVEEIAVKAAVPIAAIFVDTVSRVLPGAKENQQEDMSLFVEACEALQYRFNCMVAGVHHTNKNGGIRGSTVIPGAGDFLIETRREPGAMVGSIFVHKVKDGEDGYEVPFKVIKHELGSIVPRSSLMVDPTEGPVQAATTMAGKDGLPDKGVCREILGAIAQAWFSGAPMSVDNSARPAVQMIMARWFLKRDAVKRLLAGWMANGIIEHADFPGKKKVKGYRKLIDL